MHGITWGMHGVTWSHAVASHVGHHGSVPGHRAARHKLGPPFHITLMVSPPPPRAGMLNPNPEKRVGLDDIFQHAWFLKVGVGGGGGGVILLTKFGWLPV